ncbi:MAG: hypothetical protein E7672_08725 [Ruminococcaceae bacterium]|nr:hypothetical protein [Oscillospiraceae bacterium]
MKKLVSLILTLLILSPTFTSCSDKTNESDTKPEESESESDTYVEEPNLYNTMEVYDMDGFKMNIYGGYAGADYAHEASGIMYVDDIVGDDYLDKMHNRLGDVATKYNAKITVIEMSDTNDAIIQSVTAGTNDIQAAHVSLEFSPTLVPGGYLRNFYDLPMDLSQPYFDSDSQEKFTINNKLFFLHSDISFERYEASCVLFYNGKILTNKNINETPYDLWKEGKWTLDNMYLMTESASTDVNNDGKYILGNDVLGLAGETFRYVSPLLGSGLEIIWYDEDEKRLDFDISGELQMATGKMTNKIWTASFNTNDGGISGNTIRAAFKANKLLFISYNLATFRQLRDKDDDYSVIMWPTLNENTDPKIHMRNPGAYGVPSLVSGEEAEKNVSVILTSLAAYGHEYILEDYIRYSVVAKGARDEQSAEVLRYIVDNRVYDLSGWVGQFGSTWWQSVLDGLYASRQRSQYGKVSTALEEFVKPYFEE